MVGFNAGPVSDTVVGGHAGKTFLLTNTINTETANCAGGPMLPIWTFRGDTTGAATNGGTQAQIWVIDVNGTPVAIWGDGDQSTFDPVVQSIVFDNRRSRALGPTAPGCDGDPAEPGACRPVSGAPHSGPPGLGALARGTFSDAGVAQLAERQPSKLHVAGSNPVSRSKPSFVLSTTRSLRVSADN